MQTVMICPSSWDEIFYFTFGSKHLTKQYRSKLHGMWNVKIFLGQVKANIFYIFMSQEVRAFHRSSEKFRKILFPHMSSQFITQIFPSYRACFANRIILWTWYMYQNYSLLQFCLWYFFYIEWMPFSAPWVLILPKTSAHSSRTFPYMECGRLPNWISSLPSLNYHLTLWPPFMAINHVLSILYLFRYHFP